MAECIFCNIVSGAIPAARVYEDDQVLAFRDREPQAPVHIILIPKRHIDTLNDLTTGDAELVGRLYLAAKQVAAELGIAQSGYRTLINCNKDGGQYVMHIHMHLMGGRELGWPPG